MRKEIRARLKNVPCRFQKDADSLIFRIRNDDVRFAIVIHIRHCDGTRPDGRWGR